MTDRRPMSRPFLRNKLIGLSCWNDGRSLKIRLTLWCEGTFSEVTQVPSQHPSPTTVGKLFNDLRNINCIHRIHDLYGGLDRGWRREHFEGSCPLLRSRYGSFIVHVELLRTRLVFGSASCRVDNPVSTTVLGERVPTHPRSDGTTPRSRPRRVVSFPSSTVTYK